MRGSAVAGGVAGDFAMCVRCLGQFLLSYAQFCSVLLSSAQLWGRISPPKNVGGRFFDDSFVNSGLWPIDYAQNHGFDFVVFTYPPSVISCNSGGT